jgi:hypothetical protein
MTEVRLPQFTLKTLFAATAACALFCGYLRWTGHHALALGVAIALHILFVPVPLAFAASVAIDGWQPTVARWNLRMVLSLLAMAVLWIVVLQATCPSALRMAFNSDGA